MRKIIILAIIVFAAFAILTSCSQQNQKPVPTKVRARVLENNTITYLDIPANLQGVYCLKDTVWINMKSHEIDDLDSNAMAGVITGFITQETN